MPRVDRSLRDVKLFKNLGDEARGSIERRCNWRSFARAESIIEYHDASRSVFFLVAGTARAIIYSLSGSAVTFSDIEAGEMFGEYAAIDGKPRSASVEAIAPCLVAVLPGSTFCDVLRNEPGVAAELMQHAVVRIRELTERILEFSTLAVNNRIQAELLRLARAAGVDQNESCIRRPPTHAEIASRVSTHREAVTRELGRLTTAGLVSRQPPALLIKDVARLEQMVHDALGV